MTTGQLYLFTWDDVDRLDDIVRLAQVVDAPDGALLEALERRRGHDCTDHPVRRCGEC